MMFRSLIFVGNVCFGICLLLYLLWWVIGFRPQAKVNITTLSWMIAAACVFGIAGLILSIRGMTSAVPKSRLFSNYTAAVGGLAACVITGLVTKFGLQRPITSELFLICGWCIFALIEVNVLYGTSALTREAAGVLCWSVAVAVVVSLVCYAMYYKLVGAAGYVIGIIPLALAIAMTVILLLCGYKSRYGGIS
jgi:hypothetical protein